MRQRVKGGGGDRGGELVNLTISPLIRNSGAPSALEQSVQLCINRLTFTAFSILSFIILCVDSTQKNLICCIML